jgi:hypothetical protein
MLAQRASLKINALDLMAETVQVVGDTRRHIDIDFQSETPEELQNLVAKLEAAKAEVEKYMKLSALKEDYSPFRSWV